MLYVTTRNKRDIFTAYHAITENRGPDGGFYLPFRVVPYSNCGLSEFTKISFNHCVCNVLNRLLQTKINPRDLDSCLGREHAALNAAGHKLFVAQMHRSSNSGFSDSVKKIARLIRKDEIHEYGPWLEISTRIAFFFGIYAELLRSGILTGGNSLDVSVVSGDFLAPISLWYARAMGLPITNIICCCNENSGIWDLVYRGELRTNQPCTVTFTPRADVAVPEGLEYLISECCGTEEVENYLAAIRRGRDYCPEESHLDAIRKGFEVSVVSDSGMLRTIPSVYSTFRILLSSYGALAYTGALDYRARTKTGNICIVMDEYNPADDPQTVTKALKISPKDFRNHLF